MGKKLIRVKYWSRELRLKTSTLNTLLDKSVPVSFLFWAIGAGANGLILFALDSKFEGILPFDLSWVLASPTLIWFCLLVSPMLGAGKKVLRKLELNNDAEKSALYDSLAETSKACGTEIAHLWHKAVTNCDQDDFDEGRQIVAAYVAVAFSHIVGEKVSYMKVIVGRVENGRLDSVSLRAPVGVSNLSPVQELAEPGTTFFICIEKSRLIVIPDVRLAEGKLFKTTASNPDGGNGSLLCYPVIRPDNRICYVLSVHCSKPLKFSVGEQAFYLRELQSYGARLLEVDAHEERWKANGN